MSRTIKFRAILADSNEWVYGDLVSISDRVLIKDSSDRFALQMVSGYKMDVRCVEVRPKTVGQFTGLLDKNGVEIYEGDRFSYKTKAGNMGNFVVFKDGMFGANVMRANLSDLFIPLETYIRRHGIEVIGNIYENRELLENKS